MAYLGAYPVGTPIANSVIAGSIAANAVTTFAIAEGSVVTADLADRAVTAVKLANTGVTSGVYGNAVLAPTLTVDDQGRITGAGNVSTDVARTYTTTQTFTGSNTSIALVLSDAAEVCNVTNTAVTGNVNIDLTQQAVIFYTANASANWTVNFRASNTLPLNTLMANGQSMTSAILVTQGATAYYNTTVQVDGTATGVTTRWQGGTAPSAGNASSVDIYSYTVMKTGNATFSVFASQTRYA